MPTFSLFRSPTRINNFPYSIHNITINSSDYCSVRDLRLTFPRDLSPVKHIELSCCKTLKVLGFILHSSSEFHLLSPLKALYCILVHPLLEYNTIVFFGTPPLLVRLGQVRYC